MAYVKITFIIFTTWILTCVINGILCGIAIGAGNYEWQNIFGSIAVSIIVSLIGSIPGFIVLWIYLLLILSKWRRGRELFKNTLAAATFISAAMGFLASSIVGREFPYSYWWLILIVITSALTSVMLHFKPLKNI